MIFEFMSRLPGGPGPCDFDKGPSLAVQSRVKILASPPDVKISIFGLISPHKESPNFWHLTQTGNWTLDWVLMNITSVRNS